MERLLVTHAKLGDRDRFDYRVAYLVGRPNSVIPELQALGVECVNVHGKSGLDVRWVRRLADYVRENQVDVVHAHSPMPAAMARPALRLAAAFHRSCPRPRLVYTEHNTWDCYGNATRALNAATYKLDDAQLAVSRDAKSSVPTVLSGRVEVLTHGIDVDAVRAHRSERDSVRRALGFTNEDVVIITVAHLRTEKAYDVLLDAAHKVIETHPNAQFVSVGHGPLKEQLEQRHRELGVGDRFRFLGYRSDVLSLMAAADVFALSSHQEGLPVSFMEATALGLPSVTTAVGGLVDNIDHEQSGLLVAPGDSQALADALGRVVGDPVMRQRMAGGASQRA